MSHHFALNNTSLIRRDFFLTVSYRLLLSSQSSYWQPDCILYLSCISQHNAGHFMRYATNNPSIGSLYHFKGNAMTHLISSLEYSYFLNLSYFFYALIDQARMHPGAVKGGFMRCRPSGISTTRGSMTLGTFHELLSSLRVVLSWDRHLYPEQGEKAEWPTPWLYCHLCPPSLSLNFCLENGLYHELFYFKTFN